MSQVDRDEERMGGGQTPTVEPLIDAMRSVATTLLQDLEGAAQALQKSGQLPKESLADSIVSLRQSFRALWSTLEQHASHVGIELESLGDDLSLHALESATERIDAVYAEIGRRRAAALAVVRRVVGLRATTDAARVLLEVPRGEAEQRVAELTGEAPVGLDRLESLTSDSHPYSLLLALIAATDDLDDGAWEQRRAAVADAFGPNLAAAVARGRVIEAATGSVEPAPPPVAPAPVAPAPVAPEPVAPAPFVPAPAPGVSEAAGSSVESVPVLEPAAGVGESVSSSWGEQVVESAAVDSDATQGEGSEQKSASRRWRRRRR